MNLEALDSTSTDNSDVTERVSRIQQLCEELDRSFDFLVWSLRPSTLDLNRYLLSEVMNWMGTPEALAGALNLIDDSKGRGAVPQGVWESLEGAFVERRPYGDSPGVYTQHARASNDLRSSLFKMAIGDAKRRKSAFTLLAQIEEWRLERGRPAGEPRHPDVESGELWPPAAPA